MNAITDTDFIIGQLDDNEYSLVYGIIQHCTHNDELRDKYIYNLVATLCINQEVTVLKNSKSTQWITLLETVVAVLDKYDTSTVVTIPFANIYSYSIKEFITSFSLGKTILQELLVIPIKEIELIEKIKYAYPIQSLEDLFMNLMIDIDTDCIEGLDNSDLFIITDEMIRRGIPVRSHITKSKQYDENLYYKTFIGESSCAFKTEKSDTTLDDTEVEEEKRIKGIYKEKCSVIYYMLYGKVDTDVISKVCCYMLKKEYNDTTIARYFRTPKDSFIKYKFQIIKTLKKYKFEIPSEIEPKKLDKL